MFWLCPAEEFMPFNNKWKNMDGLLFIPEAIDTCKCKISTYRVIVIKLN